MRHGGVDRLQSACSARVGPDTAAQLLITAGTNAHRLRSEAAFAMLAGVAPIPASSGKTTRHRLSRGGDRAANNALHRIALVRWSHDPHTRERCSTLRRLAHRDLPTRTRTQTRRHPRHQLPANGSKPTSLTPLDP
jgi:transposase